MTLHDNSKTSRTIVWLAPAGALTIALLCASAAGAQSTPPPRAATVECGSNGDRTTCAADTTAGVVLVSQKGEANCVLGRTWGFDAAGVWTGDGCRGTFAFGDDRPRLSCVAAAGAREHCKTDAAEAAAFLAE